MTFKRISLLFLASVLILTCLMSCDFIKKEEPPTNEELIEEKINTFLTAYNDGDMDTVLTCLDAKTRNAFQAMLNLLGGLAGSYAGFDINLSDLFSLGVSTTSGDFMELDIESIAVSIDETRAVATTTMKMPHSNAQTIYFVMVYENDGWYINDMTDKKVSITTGVSNKVDSNIKIVKIDDEIIDGTAAIKFEINEKTYTGIINSSGKMFYYTDENYINWISLGNGSGFVKGKLDNGYIGYTFFDSNGQKTATLKGDIFEEVLGSGDGIALVYKNTSTISVEEHSYGIIDVNGNWVMPLTPGSKLPNPNESNSSWSDYEYWGDGIFYTVNEYNSYKVFYNSKTNQAFGLYDVGIKDKNIVNNSVYAKTLNPPPSMWNSLLYNPYGSNESIVLPNYFIFYFDGTFVEITEDEYNDNSGIDGIYTDNEYLQVYDATTGVTSEYTNFTTELISSYEAVDDYILVKLKGKDGKKYFTVIDKACNQKFEPVEYKEDHWATPTLFGERISYKVDEDTYELMDINGNIIVSKEQNYQYIGSFSGGIALAKIGDEACFIDLDGKPIAISME